MKKIFLSCLLLSTILLSNLSNLSAQPGFDDDVEDTPIDGGVAILTAAGIAYGIKLRMKKREEK